MTTTDTDTTDAAGIDGPRDPEEGVTAQTAAGTVIRFVSSRYSGPRQYVRSYSPGDK